MARLFELPVRRPEFDFDDVPVAWCGGDRQLSHVINGLSAVFPDGERFFMRSVAAFEDQLDDDMRALLRSFYGQEANHGRAHRAAFEMLERQGFEIRDWLEWYQGHAYGEGVESWASPRLRLATTVALEHFTATLAEVAFDPDDIFADMDPTMRALLQWHAAEEIEHKAVAFEVLQRVDPRWRTRAAGFVVGLAVLGLYATSAAHHIAKQDGTRGVRWRMLREVLGRRQVVRVALEFLQPGFHPDKRDNYALASNFLSRFATWEVAR